MQTATKTKQKQPKKHTEKQTKVNVFSCVCLFDFLFVACSFPFDLVGTSTSLLWDTSV